MPMSEERYTRSLARGWAIRLCIWHLSAGNANSAVCRARVRGDTISTSGIGCSCSALDRAYSACLIPSGVSFVSYLQQWNMYQ